MYGNCNLDYFLANYLTQVIKDLVFLFLQAEAKMAFKSYKRNDDIFAFVTEIVVKTCLCPSIKTAIEKISYKLPVGNVTVPEFLVKILVWTTELESKLKLVSLGAGGITYDSRKKIKP